MKSLSLSGILGSAKNSIISERKGLCGQYQTIPESTRSKTTAGSYFLLYEGFQGRHPVACKGNGIKKLRGVTPLTLFTVIFSLPFEGVNFSQGIVRNASLGFKKDAAYDFLKNPKHNWRQFISLSP